MFFLVDIFEEFKEIMMQSDMLTEYLKDQVLLSFVKKKISSMHTHFLVFILEFNI